MLDNLTKEQIDYVCERYNLIPKKTYQKKENGIVYIMYKDEEVLYVGRTEDIRTRMYHHFHNSEDWKLEVNRIEYFETEMYGQEIYYIHTLKPKYNKDIFADCITPEKESIRNRKEVAVLKGVITGEDFEKQITIDLILETVKQLISQGRDVNLTEEIRAKHYSVNTPNDTIRYWFKGDNKKKIQELCNSFNIELESRRGNFAGMYMIFK